MSDLDKLKLELQEANKKIINLEANIKKIVDFFNDTRISLDSNGKIKLYGKQ